MIEDNKGSTQYRCVDEVVQDFLNHKLTHNMRLAFVSAWVVGIIVHLYMLVNTLPNHDQLFGFKLPDNQLFQFAASGRWFLKIASSVSSGYSLPWMIGIISITFLALTALLLVDIFEIESKVNVILVSAILVTFPTIASTLSYMFVADAYMLALLLSVLAVKVTLLYRVGYILGGILLALSLGIYQAYASFSIVLVILLLLLKIADSQIRMGDVVRSGIRQFFMGVIGFSLYALILNICLFASGSTLLEYRGISQASKLEFGMVLNGVKLAIKDAARFITQLSILKNDIFQMLIYFVLLCTFVSFIVLVFSDKKNHCVIKYVGVAVLFLLIPIGSNYEYILSPEANLHMLTQMSWSLLFVFFLVVCERLNRQRVSVTRKLSEYLAVICCALIVYNYALVANILYFNIQQRYEKAYASVVRVVDRIEQVEGYNLKTSIALMGEDDEKEVSTSHVNVGFNLAPGMIGDAVNLVATPKHFFAFAYTFLGKDFDEASPSSIDKIQRSSEFQNMPTWPHLDSVKMVDDIIVIKF